LTVILSLQSSGVFFGANQKQTNMADQIQLDLTAIQRRKIMKTLVLKLVNLPPQPA
jgi:hypothetical protein